MRFFDKNSLIGLTSDAKRAGMNVDSYIEMMTSDTKRSEYRAKWLNDHVKFTSFVSTIENDIINKIDSNKIVIIDIDNVIQIIEDKYVSIKGIGIYNRKELMMGLYFYFYNIGIDVSGGKYDGYIEFSRMLTVDNYTK